MANKIYIDDIRLEIIIDLQMDISDATTYNMMVYKNGEEITWDAAVYESNFLRYVTEDGDLDVAGTYYIQPKLAFFGGWSGLGETVNFTVNKKWR